MVVPIDWYLTSSNENDPNFKCEGYWIQNFYTGHKAVLNPSSFHDPN